MKKAYHDRITALHRDSSSPKKTAGHLYKYHPVTDDGVRQPDEKNLVQVKYLDVLREIRDLIPQYFNLVATKDFANATAMADVVVDGEVLLKDAPVPHLLFLEKQLTDLHTLVSKMATPDPTETWTWDAQREILVSETVETQSTSREKAALVLHPPTTEHPAQTAIIEKTVVLGTWDKTKMSGAVPLAVKRTLEQNLLKLIRAVKFAREEANRKNVEEKDYSTVLLAKIFEGVSLS